MICLLEGGSLWKVAMNLIKRLGKEGEVLSLEIPIRMSVFRKGKSWSPLDQVLVPWCVR